MKKFKKIKKTLIAFALVVIMMTALAVPAMASSPSGEDMIEDAFRVLQMELAARGLRNYPQVLAQIEAIEDLIMAGGFSQIDTLQAADKIAEKEATLAVLDQLPPGATLSDLNLSQINAIATRIETVVDLAAGVPGLTLPYDLVANINALIGVIREDLTPPRAQRPPLLVPPALGWLPVPAVQPFADAVGHWGGNPIAWAHANGITAGTSPTTFHPDRLVTRAEFLTFLYRVAGKPSVTATQNFSDVPVDHMFVNAVTWAYDAGLVTGVGGGRFAPERNITRAEMATMLRNYVNLLGKYQVAPDGALGAFPDVGGVPGWAAATVSWAAHNNILGRGGSLNAPDNATRAEAVAVIHRSVVTFEVSAP